MICPFYQAVDVSMPYTTADTLTALDLTTNNLPASKTIPVRSNTPLDDNAESNSMYSATVGVAALATASCTVHALLPRLHMLTVATVNVFAGHVYNVVLVAAARSATPNLPVAIIYSP
jgi:hypothetical protein